MPLPKITVKDLLGRNKNLAVDHKPLVLLSEIAASGLPTPSVLIVTCSDPRCVPERFLGIEPMEAVVFRDMCGHVAPDIHGIVALDYFLRFSEVMVIHHTDCGAIHFTDTQAREALQTRNKSSRTFEEIDFGTIQDIKQSVKDDLAFLKESPLMRKELVENAHGYVFDIKTGLLTAV